MSQPKENRFYREKEKPYVRPSLWPTVQLCPSAALPVAYVVERPDEERNLGSAGHELYQMLPKGHEIAPDDIIVTAKAWQVDPLRLSALVEGAKEAWETLQPYFPSAEVEYRFDYDEYIKGRAPGTNIVLQNGDMIIVPD